MATPQYPTATRMEFAREFRGVSIEKLCTDLHIDQSTYEIWEDVEEDYLGNGVEGVYNYEIPPAVELMQEIADYLGFPLGWFYADEMELRALHCSPVSGSQFLDQQIEETLKKIDKSEPTEEKN